MKPQWLCEFCYMRAYTDRLPLSWEWVWQSAVCPDCATRVQGDGGYAVVKGGAYAEVPDPRPWPSDASHHTDPAATCARCSAHAHTA